MASTSVLEIEDEEMEEFSGFEEEDLDELEARQNEDSESDISVSSVNTEDLENLSELEADEVEAEAVEEEWCTSEAPVHVPPFTAVTGPVSHVPDNKSAIDFFHLMFPESLIETIVTETNRYARQCTAVKPDAKWYDTTLAEMKAYLGLHIIFGIKQLPANRHYWSKDPVLGVQAVQKVMPRNRFDKLTQYLHVNDNSNQVPREDPAFDKLFKVRPLLHRVLECCQQEHRPGQNLSIDEAMVKFKGRLGIKQYMPQKPIKRGIKIWECADSSNGFVSEYQVYTGKQQDGTPEENLGYRVVHDLTRNFTGKNHDVFFDNYFSSVKLSEDLLKDAIYSCGTVRANRKGYPKELAKKAVTVKRLSHGEHLFRRKNNLVATAWKDKKVVNFLSTQSNPVGNETVPRKQRDGTIIQVPSAPVVRSYNKNMGGVDLSDQLHGYYAVGRKSRKWWRYLFWFCVDFSIVNASILETLAPNHSTRKQLAFRLELAKKLIGDFQNRGLSPSSGNLEGGHWPIPFSKGRCKRCLKNKRNTFCRMGCELCNKRCCLTCFKNHQGHL